MFYLTILLRDNREDQTIRRLVPLYQVRQPQNSGFHTEVLLHLIQKELQNFWLAWYPLGT